MNKRAMIVIFSVIIVVLIVILICMITVRDGWNNYPGAHRLQESRDLTPGAVFEFPGTEVEAVDLDFLSENVRIVPVDGDLVRVEQRTDTETDVSEQIRCGLRGGTLVVESPPHRMFSCWPRSSQWATVTVEIPKAMLISAEVDTMSGSVEVGDLRFSDLRVSTASGRIDVRGVKATEMEGASMSGDIDLADIDTRTLRCSSTSGSISIQGSAEDTAELESTSGSVTFAGSCAELHAESTSGNVNCEVRCTELHAESTSGNISCEVRGAKVCEADSLSGDIRLTCLDAVRLEQIDCEVTSGAVTLALPTGTALSIQFDSLSGNLNLDQSGSLRLGGGIEVDVSSMSGDLTVQSLPGKSQ